MTYLDPKRNIETNTVTPNRLVSGMFWKFDWVSSPNTAVSKGNEIIRADINDYAGACNGYVGNINKKIRKVSRRP